MSEEARKRNAIMQSIQNLEQRISELQEQVKALEDGRSGWEAWARQLIIALIAALLGILGYTEFVL